MNDIQNQFSSNSDDGRIKISWVIPTLDQGGAEKQLVTLAASIDKQSFAPEIVTLTRSGHYRQRVLDAGIALVEINKKGKLDPFAYQRLVKHFKARRPDIVHTWIFAANAYGRMAAIQAKTPVVFGGERCVDPWKRGWELAIDRFLANRATGILTNSSGIRDFYASKGIVAEKFTIIPNGIAPARPCAITREQALHRLGLPPDTLLIGSVGRLWPQKGYKDLVWAAGMLTVVRPNMRYVILGEGPQLQLLEQYRDSTGAGTAVVFAGHRPDASDLLPHFDLLWNGSLYEGQSNSIMEAMQAGLPVIATDIAGNRDLIEHDVSGILYNVGAVDQLLRATTRILDEPDLGAELGRGAQQRIAESFTVAQMVQRHEHCYRQALERRATE